MGGQHDGFPTSPFVELTITGQNEDITVCLFDLLCTAAPVATPRPWPNDPLTVS